MNAFELLQKWPSWQRASAETIFDSPAWAMPVRWKDIQCVMRRADIKFRDILGIGIKFDDEENFIGLANRESFPDLHVLWDVKNNLPDPLKLALVEKECGPLFQILENAARRQLNVVGVQPSEKREDSTGFEITTEDGKILASFDLKITPEIIRSFGMLKNIDVTHESIRSMTRKGRAEFASFILKESELAGLAQGDYIMLPEIGSIPPKWQIDPPKDNSIHVYAPELTDLTFAEFADDMLPEIPQPTALTLIKQDTVVANGRLTTLAGKPAVALEEIL